jgi:putative membrane protein
MRLLIPSVAVLTALGAGWCTAADTPDNSQPFDTTANPQLAPQAFIDQAASAGMLEVKTSQLALTKGVDQQVRNFAQQMIDDHQKANQELQRLAARKGWNVRPDLAADDQKQFDKLQGYTGDEFGKQYAKLQISAHDDAVALFDRGSRDLTDSDLRQFARKYLPTLQHHQQMARDLKGEEKGAKTEGGQQSGTIGSDSWSSQSTVPGASNSSSSPQQPVDSSQDWNRTDNPGTTTIESDIHGTAKMPGQQPNGPDNQQPSTPNGSTDRDNSQQRSDVDNGVSGSSQNQGTMYKEPPRSGTGY